MASKTCKFGCMSGIPSGIKIKDMTKGKTMNVKTGADLVGKKPHMVDQTSATIVRGLKKPDLVHGRKK